ncbi:MAG: serine acetyltransferase [Clostridia bacterium]|nr:serine acetyltransferase [Clostridia bacterium]
MSKIPEIAKMIMDKTMAERSFGEGHESAQPDRCVIIAIVKKIKEILFPFLCGNGERESKEKLESRIVKDLEDISESLIQQTARALSYDESSKGMKYDERLEKAKGLTDEFLRRIPCLIDLLKMDLDAAFDGDPAATSKDEIAYCYPGFSAIETHRIAHELFLLGVPLIPRIMSESAHSETGVDIHPGATIGHHFFIDHGTGVVIGETSEIGNYVKIYQGVTLGGLSTRAGQALRGKKRHPTIKDNVTIYSNASILGGQTVINEGVVIGGNCFITESIPAHVRVVYDSPKIRHIPIEKDD